MSHFTVMVIGENPEEQLAPFQENNMGDCPKEYLKYNYSGTYFNTEEEARADAKSRKEEFDPKEGYWENPNSKWDWYVLGGRWTGYFKIAEEEFASVGEPGIMTPRAKKGFADQSIKSNIDFEGMKKKVCDEAVAEWEQVNDVIKNTEKCKSRGECRADFPGNTDAARDFYHSQERVKAFNSIKKGFFSSLDDYDMPKDQFISGKVESYLTPFAVIKDGKWYQKGKMGWWGMVSDEKDQAQWDKEFNALIEGLPEDTLLSVYDCHI